LYRANYQAPESLAIRARTSNLCLVPRGPWAVLTRQSLERFAIKNGGVKVNPEQSIHLAGFNLGKHRHVCAFFHTQDQEDRVLVPFFKEGIDRGEKAFCVLDSKKRMHLLKKLGLAGIEVTSAEKHGQLEVKKWEETYVQEGRFDQDAMLAFIQDVLSQGTEKGFALTRFVARMEWAREYRVGINELVEYETRLNQVLRRFNDPVICVYNLAKFDAGVVLDILRTHPIVIIGDLVAENPFFVPPDVFLRELSERGAYSRRETVRPEEHEH
jgi:MEDS: MEthanogen/methylotroph, DcmR Sensory domain